MGGYSDWKAQSPSAPESEAGTTSAYSAWKGQGKSEAVENPLMGDLSKYPPAVAMSLDVARRGQVYKYADQLAEKDARSPSRFVRMSDGSEAEVPYTEEEIMSLAEAAARDSGYTDPEGASMSRPQAFTMGLMHTGLKTPVLGDITLGALTALDGDPDKSAQDYRDELRYQKGIALDNHPTTTRLGDATGFMSGIGGLGWKMGTNALAKAAPHVSKAVPAAIRSGQGLAARGTRYAGRLAAGAGALAADAAAYGAIVEGDNMAIEEGRDTTWSDRLGMAKDLATHPATLLAAPVFSAVRRGWTGATSGGRTFTPSQVAARQLTNGVAPRATDVSQGVFGAARAAVGGAEDFTSRTVKALNRVETMMKNIAPDAYKSGRVAEGFQNIQSKMDEVANGRLTFAQLIEREFTDLGIDVPVKIRTFLRKVGLDNQGATAGMIGDARASQVDELKGAIDDNLGSQSAFDAEAAVVQGLDALGAGYQQVLSAAPTDSRAAKMIGDAMIGDKRALRLLKKQASQSGAPSVEDYIRANPWEAAHWYQSKLAGMAHKSNDAVQAEDLLVDVWDLQSALGKNVPGYNETKKVWAQEANVRDQIGYYSKGPGGKETYNPGFGEDLKKAARTDRGEERIAGRYAGLDERAQAAADLSTGAVLRDSFRGARPSGMTTEAAGETVDVVNTNLTNLQNDGVLDTLGRVFGERGQSVARTFRDIAAERRFLNDIDPNTGSPTVNKANAQARGDDVIQQGVVRRMSDSGGDSMAMAADGALAATGNLPIVSALKGIPNTVKRVFGPGQKTREEIANLLLAQPESAHARVSRGGEIVPKTGRNRPRAWRRAYGNQSDLAAAGEQASPAATPSQNALAKPPAQAGFIPPALVEPAGGAVIGGGAGSVFDLDNDGVAGTPEDRGLGLMLGLSGGFASRAIRGRRPAVDELKPAPDNYLKSFETGGGNQVDVLFAPKNGGKHLEVDMRVDGSQYRKRDAPIQPMSEVRDIMSGTEARIRQEVASTQPQTITFFATTKARANLYNRMINNGGLEGYNVTRRGKHTLILHKKRTGDRSKAADKATDAATLGAAAIGASGAADASESPELEEARMRVSEFENSVIPGLQAQLTALESPDVPPEEKQRVLQQMGYDLGPMGVDGKIGPRTREALREKSEQIRGDIDKVRRELDVARNRVSDLEARAVFAEQSGGPVQDFLREAAPWAGMGLGLLASKKLRGRAVNKSQTSARALERQANALVRAAPVTRSATGPNALNTRAAHINEFWRLGGAGDNVPFRATQKGRWMPRPGVADPSHLYPATGQRFRAGDAGLMGGAVVETAAATAGAEESKRKIAKLEADLERYTSVKDTAGMERTMAALEREKNWLAAWTMAQRAGAFTALGSAGAAFAKPYAVARPNVAGAERERALLLQEMSKKNGQR